jgi:hypothetical protein
LSLNKLIEGNEILNAEKWRLLEQNTMEMGRGKIGQLQRDAYTVACGIEVVDDGMIKTTSSVNDLE